MHKTHAEAEIFSQPEVWEQAIALAPKVAGHLPSKGQRVAFVGCGTSWFMSMISASLREHLGLGESDAFTASEFPMGRKYDLIVAITRSGTTTEVVELLRNLKGKTPTVVITAVAGSPVTEQADETILMEFADEESVLQTRYATAVLALLRTHYGQDLTNVVAQCRKWLAEPLDPELVDSEQITFLGAGWTVGFAQEAALKTRESSQFWAEAYPAMDYRHGPMSIAQKGRAVWMFGNPPAGLAKEVAQTGALWVHSEDDPMAHLAYAQRVAVAISQSRGLDADHPRGLSRSIILN